MRSLRLLLAEKPLSLIVSLPANEIELAKAAVENGADAVKVHLNVAHRASGNSFGSLDEQRAFFEQLVDVCPGPVGVVPGGGVDQVKQEELSELDEMGINYFSIYSHHMPTHMLEVPMEKTAAMDSSYTLDAVRALNQTALDAFEASVIPGEAYGTALTFHDLLKYRLIVDALKIPVIVPSQRKITAQDIPHLGETGIRAVMIGAVVTGHSTETLAAATAEFRQAIDRWHRGK